MGVDAGGRRSLPSPVPRFINKLQPGSVKKVNESTQNWHQLENIGNFIKAITKYGVKPHDIFEANDLFENTNHTQVQSTLLALASMAKTKGNKVNVGVKYAEKQERKFEPEKLREGRNIIGLQVQPRLPGPAADGALGAGVWHGGEDAHWGASIPPRRAWVRVPCSAPDPSFRPGRVREAPGDGSSAQVHPCHPLGGPEWVPGSRLLPVASIYSFFSNQFI